ncbi:MAG: hypothetical protein ACYC2K_18730 [Gemmatimonadales bacterium]
MTPAEQLQAAVDSWSDLLRDRTTAERWEALEHLAKRCDAVRDEARATMERYVFDMLAITILARGDGLVVRVPPTSFRAVHLDAARWAHTRAMESAAGLPMGSLGTEEG